jgi:hypothetical protein
MKTMLHDYLEHKLRRLKFERMTATTEEQFDKLSHQIEDTRREILALVVEKVSQHREQK